MKEIILSPNMCRWMDGFALWFIAYTSLSRDSYLVNLVANVLLIVQILLNSKSGIS